MFRLRMGPLPGQDSARCSGPATARKRARPGPAPVVDEEADEVPSIEY